MAVNFVRRRHPAATTLPVMAALMVVILTALRSQAVVGDEDLQVGYGYRVICVHTFLNGDAIVADLEVVKQTDTFGPDIQRLQLTVRYRYPQTQ